MRTVWIITLLAAGFLGCASSQEPNIARTTALDARAMMSRIGVLSSQSFSGRRVGTPGGTRAQAYIAGVFEQLGLLPVPGVGRRHKIPEGANVLGLLPGRGSLADEMVVVGAHFDHLGTRRGDIFPGANNNASGVAVMFAVAKALQVAPPKTRRAVLFVAFDGGEERQRGSRAFIANPPVNLSLVRAAFILDMVGAPRHAAFSNMWTVLGTEKSPELQRIVDATRPAKGFEVNRLGLHLIENMTYQRVIWSDYAPFRDRQIPFAFVTAGVNRSYQTANDTLQTMDPRMLSRGASWLFSAINTARTTQGRLTFSARREDTLEDLNNLVKMLLIALKPNSGFTNAFAKPERLKAHLDYLESYKVRLMRGGALSNDQLAELRRAMTRLTCYSAGPDSPIARTCSGF